MSETIRVHTMRSIGSARKGFVAGFRSGEAILPDKPRLERSLAHHGALFFTYVSGRRMGTHGACMWHLTAHTGSAGAWRRLRMHSDAAMHRRTHVLVQECDWSLLVAPARL